MTYRLAGRVTGASGTTAMTKRGRRTGPRGPDPFRLGCGGGAVCCRLCVGEQSRDGGGTNNVTEEVMLVRSELGAELWTVWLN